MLTHQDITRIYLRNRADFYVALLPRIPHSALRALLAEAVQPDAMAGEIAELIEFIPATEPDEFLARLALRDVFKKAAFGSGWGRTTISFEEALSRGQWVEESGILLFDALAGLHPALSAQAQRHRAVLSALLRLDDELRYHKRRV